jgi:TRAP-type C4-dicarboxylate transport system substrate-binding protein
MNKRVFRDCAVAALVALLSTGAHAQQVLKLATTLPPTNPIIAKFFDPWAKKVNEAAGGEFQIQVVNGPTIANAVNVWERTVNGVVEIGWGIHGAVSLPFAKSLIMGLPLLFEENQLGAASAAFWQLYASGLIADEYKDVKVLGLVGTPVQGISSKTPITKLDDMKGLKVRAADRSVADIVAALGGAPISVPAAEVYQALSQGVVSASVAGFVLVTSFKLQEVVHYHLEGLPLGAPAGFIVMNRQAYERLSPKGKQVLDRYAGEALSREFGTFFQEWGIEAKDGLRSSKEHHFNSLDPQERARWVKTLEPVVQQWVKSTPNGDKVLAALRASLQKAAAR